jgi:hypothetical protein
MLPVLVLVNRVGSITQEHEHAHVLAGAYLVFSAEMGMIDLFRNYLKISVPPL